MKRLLFIIMLVVSSSSFSQQYKTALGFKGGYPNFGSINVKHFFNSPNAIEASLGGGRYHLWMQGLYERNYAIPKADGLDFYWGLGADLGFWTNNYHYYDKKHNKYYNGVWGGIDAVVGLEYTFPSIPFNIALDMGPTIRLFPYVGFGYNGGLALRYAFI